MLRQRQGIAADWCLVSWQEAERRLKDLLAGKRPAGNTLATANGTTAAAKKQQMRQQRSQPYVFQAKIQLDDETRSMHMTGQVTYAELQHAVREKFPSAGPLILKYLDREGDLVTITDRNDLQVALKEVVENAEKAAGQHGGPRLPNMIPPLRLHATRAKSEVSTSLHASVPAIFHEAHCTRVALHCVADYRVWCNASISLWEAGNVPTGTKVTRHADLTPAVFEGADCTVLYMDTISFTSTQSAVFDQLQVDVLHGSPL